MTITNVVIALKIITTANVPVSCPDGIEGCCVLHMENRVIETRYEEFKMWDDESKIPDRGVGLCIDSLCEDHEIFNRTAKAYGCTNNMPYPIRSYRKNANGSFTTSHNIIGVFWPFEVDRASKQFDSAK